MICQTTVLGMDSKKLVAANSFWAALLVHGCFEGLAVGNLTTETRWVVLGTLYVHKIVEYAALSVLLRGAGLAVTDPRFWLTAGTSEIPCVICFLVAWCRLNSISSWLVKC